MLTPRLLHIFVATSWLAIALLVGVAAFLTSTTDVGEEEGFWWVVGTLAFLVGVLPWFGVAIYLGRKRLKKIGRYIFEVIVRANSRTLWKVVGFAMLLLTAVGTYIIWKAHASGHNVDWRMLPVFPAIPLALGLLYFFGLVVKAVRDMRFEERRKKWFWKNAHIAFVGRNKMVFSQPQAPTA